MITAEFFNIQEREKQTVKFSRGEKTRFVSLSGGPWVWREGYGFFGMEDAHEPEIDFLGE